MRKIYAIVVASLLTFTANSFAEMGMGITANYAMTSTSGSETLRDSGKVTNATHDEDVTIPELFIEVIRDQGVFGLAYVPVTELGSKSRTDSNSEGSSGTYKGSAEISDHVTVYADWNLSEFMGSNQNLFYDISLHFGTLMAVCIYFRSDLIEIVNSVIKHRSLSNNLLLRQLFISCIPTLFLGFILIDLIDGYLRTSTVIAATTIFFGFILFL